MATRMLSLQGICLKAIQKELVQGVEPNIWAEGEFQSVDIKFVSRLLDMERSEKIPVSRLSAFWGCGLERLDLSVFEMRGKLIDEILAESIGHFPALQALSITNIHITDYGLAQIATASNITELDLSHCTGFTMNGLAALGALAELLHLNLEECHLDLQYWPLSDLKFKSLKLGGNAFHAEAIASIIESHGTTLIDLSIWGADCFGTHMAETLLTQLTCIEKLDFKWIAPINSQFYRCFGFLESLIELDCGHTPFGDELVEHIRSLQLCDLRLTSTNISFRSLISIAVMTSLQYLNLDFNDLSIPPEEGSIWSFRGLTNLKSLSMSNCTITISGAFERTLFHDADGSPQEQEIGTDINSVEGDDSQLLVSPTPPGILFPVSLRVLNVAGSMWSRTRALAESVAALSNLRALNMSDVTLNPVHRWKGALEAKKKLRSLELARSNVPPDVLAGCLEGCRGGVENLAFADVALVPRALARCKSFPKLATVDLSLAFITAPDYQRTRAKLFPLIDWAPPHGTFEDSKGTSAVGVGAIGGIKSGGAKNGSKKGGVVDSAENANSLQLPKSAKGSDTTDAIERKGSAEGGQTPSPWRTTHASSHDKPRVRGQLCAPLGGLQNQGGLDFQKEPLPEGLSVSEILAARSSPASRFTPPGLRLPPGLPITATAPVSTVFAPHPTVSAAGAPTTASSSPRRLAAAAATIESSLDSFAHDIQEALRAVDSMPLPPPPVSLQAQLAMRHEKDDNIHDIAAADMTTIG